MNMPDQLNAAIRFIEENLCGEIDGDELARIACVTKDDFMCFFSYMTLNEIHPPQKTDARGI